MRCRHGSEGQSFYPAVVRGGDGYFAVRRLGWGGTALLIDDLSDSYDEEEEQCNHFRVQVPAGGGYKLSGEA